MTGLRLACDGHLSATSPLGDDVFYASVSTVLAKRNLDSAQPWVCVDGQAGTIVPMRSAEVFEVPVRTLWFNVAMLGFLLRGGLLVHAAGASLKGRGLLFLGVSGIGKSTLSRLLEDAFPDSVLGDERLGVRPDFAGGSAHWKMVGSPWSSSAGIARRREAPLSALVFLEQASENTVDPLSASEAMRRMLALISVDWKLDALADRGVQALDGLLASIPAFVFRFQNDPVAVYHLARWAESLPLSGCSTEWR